MQFAKIERRRKRNEKDHDNDVHPNVHVDRILQKLNKKSGCAE